MGLLDFIRKKSSPVAIFSRFNGGGSSISARNADQLYTGWVFACVRAIAEEVAKIDLVLTKVDSSGNKTIIPTHPAIDLIYRVNSFMTKHTLFERLQSNKELRGNEYWFVVRDKAGVPVEIYPLNMSAIKPIIDPYNYVSGYEYRMSGDKTEILSPENVIHFKNFSPKSDVIGMSTLEAVRVSVETDEHAKIYNRAFFENSAQPGVIIKMRSNPTQDIVDKIKAQWNQEFRGSNKNYGTAVLPEGVEIDRLQVNHADMEFIQQRQFSRDEILAIFRVPKTILGIMEEVNFASAKTANYVFALRTILPKMNSIVDTLNEFYLPMFNEEGLEFEFRNPVPEDRAELIQYYTAGLNNGWLTHNEIRRMEGLPELENGDTTYIPFSLMPNSRPKEKLATVTVVKAPLQGAIKSLSDAIVKEIEDPKEEQPEPSKSDRIQTRYTEEEFDRIGEGKALTAQQRAKGFEKKYKSTAQDLFEDQKERAIKELERQMSKKYRRKASELDLLDEAKEVKTTIDLFTPIATALFQVEGQAALDFLGIDDEFSISPDVRKFIEKNVKKFAGTITETTSQELRSLIAAGLEAGEDIDALTERIEDFSGFSSSRAEMIALTEVSRGQSEAEIAAWEETGVVESTIWYTALDERVDDECASLHGVEVGLGDTFLTADELRERGINPYAGSLDNPPLHPNCRCVLLPVVGDAKAYSPKWKVHEREALIQKFLELNNDEQD